MLDKYIKARIDYELDKEDLEYLLNLVKVWQETIKIEKELKALII